MGNKCLQPELNVVWDSEHGNGKCGVCGRLTFWRHGSIAVDVELDNCSGPLCFERHRLISDVGDKRYVVGVRIDTGIKFCTRSKNGFIFGDDVIMGLGIGPGKGGFKPGVKLGKLLKLSGNELNCGIQGTGDTGVLFNVEMECAFVDGKHGGREDFEALDEVKRLITILVSNCSLLMDVFWLVLEPAGTESNVLFDDTLNTLGFNSDSGLILIDVVIGFGIRGSIGVVFNLVWRSEYNDDNNGKEEVWLDNKFLIKSFINSGL